MSADAIQPWSYRSWASPRDPCCAEKAGPVLGLYQETWQGQPLGAEDYVLCAEERGLLDFPDYYQQIATPIDRRFPRADLRRRLAPLGPYQALPVAA